MVHGKDHKISYRHIELPFKYFSKQKKGLSESYVKKLLERKGFVVWRSEYFHLDFTEHYYNVRKKYDRLRDLLDKFHPGVLDELKYLNHVHHGMPDFIVFKDNKFMFIECKFNHEQLMIGQRKCISKLLDLGFQVEIYKLVHPKTRARSVEEDLITRQKKIKEKQMKLKKRY